MSNKRGESVQVGKKNDGLRFAPVAIFSFEGGSLFVLEECLRHPRVFV